MKKCFFLFLCLLLLQGQAWGQKKVKFSLLSTDQGLSQKGVRAIFQDSKGFIWVGTQNGLNRFNGYSFEVFRHIPKDSTSLVGNAISAICEDDQGRLWIGVEGAGLSCYDPLTHRFINYRVNVNWPQTIANNVISFLHYDKKDRLWIGTSGAGIDCLHTKEGRFEHYPPNGSDPRALPTQYIKQIFQDSKGRLWAAHDEGFSLILEDDKGIFFQNHKYNPDQLSGLPNKYAKACIEDREGNLWIGTDGGLSCFNPEKGDFKNFFHDPLNISSLGNNYVKTLGIDKQGNIWVGTDGGVSVLDVKKETFRHFQPSVSDPFSLSNNYVKAIYTDQLGAVWVGTDDGINVYDAEKEQFELFQYEVGKSNNLSSNNIFAIYEDQGKVWVGTDNGLNIIDRNTGNVQYIGAGKGLSNNNVKAIYKDAKGNCWLGTDNGLNLLTFDAKGNHKVEVFTSEYQNSNSLSNNAVVSIFEDSKGLLWVATWGGGANIFDREKKQFISFNMGDQSGLTSSEVRCFYEDPAGRIWVGTRGGLCRFDRDTRKFTAFQSREGDASSLSNNWILSMYGDSQRGVIWLGTDGSGLEKFDIKTGVFTHYTAKEGLPNEVVQSILGDDQGNLWMGSSHGLIRFDTKSGKFHGYDVNDGLQSNSFYVGCAFKGNGGEMYFGGSKGFNAFYPRLIKENSFAPPVYITSLKVLNQAITPRSRPDILKQDISQAQEIKLSYKDQVVSIEFVALNFRNAVKNQYAYRLDPLDKDWHVAGADRRDATYTYLQPGTYTFRVKASNNDGVWAEEERTLKIVVTPPFWDLMSFRVAATFVVLGGAYLFYRWRVRSIQEQKKELEREVSERTQEVQEKNKKLTDSIRYGTSIQHAMLPNIDQIPSAIAGHFVLYKPKDLVSGDFYWFACAEGITFVAVVDCTGHGVPGAFMSMIGNTLLSEIVNSERIYSPAQILDRLDERVKESLNQAHGMNDDGMDMALCRIEPTPLGKFEIVFAGAKNPLLYVPAHGEWQLIKGDKRSLGGMLKLSKKPFQDVSIQASPGDSLYLFSDGFADQPDAQHHKIGSATLHKTLAETANLGMKEQHAILEQILREHGQNTEQRDDITVLGIRL